MRKDRSFLKQIEDLKGGWSTASGSLVQIFSISATNQFENIQQEALYRLWVLPAVELKVTTSPKTVTMAWDNIWKQNLRALFTETGEDLVSVSVSYGICGAELAGSSASYSVVQAIMQSGIWEDGLLRPIFAQHVWGKK